MGSSSALIRNYASISDQDDDLGVHEEVMETDGAILMSLLEEFQDEDGDDEERLKTVIQSLEAEIINPSMMNSQRSRTPDSELIIKDVGDGNLWNIGGDLDCHDCSVSSVDCDNQMGWFDMAQVACSPSHDMNWYMDSCEYEMDSPADHSGWDGGFSHCYYGVGLEEHVYSSLWQETAYDSIMHE